MARRPTRPRDPDASPDAAAAEIRAAIRAHVPDAIRELARLAREATSEQARVSAINALIDRGYGDLKHLTEPDEGVAGIAGTFLAAIISGLGLRRGEAEKKGLPAADASLSAGVFVGLEAETQRALLEELRDVHADLVAWRRQDEVERRADRDRTTVERFEQIESNQAKILGLLRKIDETGGQDPHRGR